MTLEEELLKDAQDDARTVAYMRQQLPDELQKRFTDDLLYYFLDLMVEYYAESGILDAEPDAEGFVDIDAEAIAAHLSSQAAREGMGNFTSEELLCLVEAQLDCMEQEAEDEADNEDA